MEIDWENISKPKVYLYYNTVSRMVGADVNYFGKITTIFFSSREIAEAAIEVIGEERLKKYYFEVEG